MRKYHSSAQRADLSPALTECVRSELPPLTGSYDLRLVGLSALIAIELAYSGFELNERLIAAGGRVRAAWRMCGAVIIGVAQWVGTLWSGSRPNLPVPVPYHYPTLILAFVR